MAGAQDSVAVKLREHALAEDEHTRLVHELTELTHELEQVENDDASLLNELQTKQPQLDESSEHLRQVESDNRLLTNDLEKQLTEARSLFAEHSDLTSRVEYLVNKLEATDQVRHIDLDQLKQVIDTNARVNDTITGLVGKWGSIAEYQSLHRPPTN
jgi:predicted nuclease with TOPRIM domain